MDNPPVKKRFSFGTYPCGIRKAAACFLLGLSFALFSVTGMGEEAKKPQEPDLPESDGDRIRLDFRFSSQNGKSVTGGWHYQGKPFTRDIDFSVVELDGKKVLKVASRNSSGTILYDLSTIDLQKYPLMRWKWMAVRLPEGACATDPGKDDQVLAVCAGAGLPRTNSVAFRWETTTPRGQAGSARYGLGMVLVNWIAMRNQEDKLNTWYVEEVNLLEHLKKLFPKGIPKTDLALSITGNSQYTGTESLGYIEYLEFLPASRKGQFDKGGKTISLSRKGEK
ncbi:MAG: DUF3047 domain-containing protein [Lentisphaeria bacterium]|nr:DUF3047 domain-containing protein [Lentisphaeria bacterium]